MNGSNTSKPEFSIIIPEKTDRGTLEKCLSAVFSAGEGMSMEVIVVDDGMDEKTRKTAERYPVRITPNNGQGVSAARNTGAHTAKGDIILFIDSDIILPENGLKRLEEDFKDPETDGVVGLLSDEVPYSDFFSDYKNLWMHFTYLTLPSCINLFYTSIAAMRRKKFIQTGGFDEKYRKPSVEDTDFGRKICDAGLKIVSDKELKVVHLKTYDFWSVIKTDFNRSAALMKHILRHPFGKRSERVGQTSVPLGFMLGVPLSVLSAAAFTAFLFSGFNPAYIFLIMAFLFLFYFFNRKWLFFLLENRGALFFFKSCIFLLLDIVCVDFGIVWGILRFAWKGDHY